MFLNPLLAANGFPQALAFVSCLFASDLLQALRDVMQDELDEAGLDSSSVLFTQHEVASLLDTSAFHSPVSACPSALLLRS